MGTSPAKMNASVRSPLEELVAEKLRDFRPDAIAPFDQALLSHLKGRVRSLVAYGSCLSDVTRSSTSTPDFYVTCSSYKRFHASILHRAMNWFLPPSIYRFQVNSQGAKYNVISEKDLRCSTATHALDVYHLGRFSKRIAVVWSEDAAAFEAIVSAQASALRSVARRVYYSMPQHFALEDFIRKALALSYEGEFRVEAADKIDRLYQAEKDHYDRAFSLVLGEMSVTPWSIRRAADGMYERPLRELRDTLGQFFLWRFLRRSRLRAKLRWPKGMVTVEGWIDYLLAKIERTHGLKIELTERERKYPFIYAWKYLFRLRKSKVAK